MPKAKPRPDADPALQIEPQTYDGLISALAVFGDAFVAPFKYDAHSAIVFDSKGTHVLDVRGWGHLTGGAAMRLRDDEANRITDTFGSTVAWLLTHAPALLRATQLARQMSSSLRGIRDAAGDAPGTWDALHAAANWIYKEAERGLSGVQS